MRLECIWGSPACTVAPQKAISCMILNLPVMADRIFRGIGGMSIDGLIATLSVIGSVNTDVFLFYVQEILIPIALGGGHCLDG